MVISGSESTFVPQVPLRPRVPSVGFFVRRLALAVPWLAACIAFSIGRPQSATETLALAAILGVVVVLGIVDSVTYFQRASLSIDHTLLSVRKAWGAGEYSVGNITCVAIRPIRVSRRHQPAPFLVILHHDPLGAERWPLFGFDLDSVRALLSGHGVPVDITDEVWPAKEFVSRIQDLDTAKLSS